MSAIDDFIDRHRSWPWPITYEDGASAQPLYEAYVAETEAEDRRVMTVQEWSPALLEHSYIRRERIAGGYVYSGLFVKTREAKARDEARSKLFRRLYAREKAEHNERIHPDGFGYGPDQIETFDQGLGPQQRVVRGWKRSTCDHRMPPDAVARLWAEIDADEAEIAAIVERDYGPYLRWVEGEQHPATVKQEAEWERRRAAGDQTVDAEIANRDRIRAAVRAFGSGNGKTDQIETEVW